MQSVFDIFSGGLNYLKGKWIKLILLFFVVALLYILCLLPIFAFVDFKDFADASHRGVAETEYWYVTLYQYLIGFFVATPVVWALSVMFLRNVRGEENSFEISRLFDGFKDYVRITFTQLLVNICTILWGFLLIVPGIMKFYSYAMTPYVLYDNPNVGFGKAMDISSKMMYGYRFKLFGLHCLYILLVFAISMVSGFIAPFVGMIALAGIGIFIVVLIAFLLFVIGLMLYSTLAYQSSMANFYNQLKMEYEPSQNIAETSKDSETAV